MKRLMYLIPLSALAVLLFVSIAVAQDSPEEAIPPDDEGTQTLNYIQTSVSILPSGFFNRNLEVAPGTTVQWINTDTETHTVTEENGFFNSGPIGPGESFYFTFDEGPGKWTYYSTLDPDWAPGNVIVTDPNAGPPNAPAQQPASAPTPPTAPAEEPASAPM